MDPKPDDRLLFDDMLALEETHPEEAVNGFIEEVRRALEDPSADLENFHELSIVRSCVLLARLHETEKLVKFLLDIRPIFITMPSSRAIELVSIGFDSLKKIPNTNGNQSLLFFGYVNWCSKENLLPLRQNILARQANLFLEAGRPQKALNLVGTLRKEASMLSSKSFVAEIDLLESRIHYALQDFAQAKSFFQVAQHTAEALEPGPSLQANLDLHGGKLAMDEDDLSASYAYFTAAQKKFAAIDDPLAVKSFQYMILCKIMNKESSDVLNTLEADEHQYDFAVEIHLMRVIAKACSNGSLEAFEAAYRQHEKHIQKDTFLQTYLNYLRTELSHKEVLQHPSESGTSIKDQKEPSTPTRSSKRVQSHSKSPELVEVPEQLDQPVHKLGSQPGSRPVPKPEHQPTSQSVPQPMYLPASQCASQHTYQPVLYQPVCQAVSQAITQHETQQVSSQSGLRSRACTCNQIRQHYPQKSESESDDAMHRSYEAGRSNSSEVCAFNPPPHEFSHTLEDWFIFVLQKVLFMVTAILATISLLFIVNWWEEVELQAQLMSEQERQFLSSCDNAFSSASCDQFAAITDCTQNEEWMNKYCATTCDKYNYDFEQEDETLE